MAVGLFVLFRYQSWKDLSPGQATLLASGGAIIAGGLAFSGAWITRRGAERNLDKQLGVQKDQIAETIANERASRELTHNRETARDLRARFAVATQQLAADATIIRVAGVYALASLADDWHLFDNSRERQVCIDLLCAQLKALNPEVTTDLTVRSAIVKVIGDHVCYSRRKLPENNWCRCHFDLRGADLRSVQLPKAVLFDPVLAGCNLANALLLGAHLTHAHLRGADLSGAMLNLAILERCDLTDATIDDRTSLDDISYDADTLWPETMRPPPNAGAKMPDW